MKNDTIKVGVTTRSKNAPAPFDYSVEVKIKRAETLADVRQLAENDEAYIVACFNRAHDINLQERSGAREAVRDLLIKSGVTSEQKLTAEQKRQITAAATKCVDEYDHTEKRARTPRQTVVTLDASAMQDPAKLVETLRAQGITVTGDLLKTLGIQQ